MGKLECFCQSTYFDVLSFHLYTNQSVDSKSPKLKEFFLEIFFFNQDNKECFFQREKFVLQERMFFPVYKKIYLDLRNLN